MQITFIRWLVPFSKEFAEEWIGSPDTGRTRVFCGAQTGGPFKEKVISMDGRRYISEGKVTFKNGTTLSAKFDIDTTHFDLLVLNSLKVFLNGLWYQWYERELVSALNVNSSDEILPFMWTPLLPLKYHKQAPYPMRFHDKHVEEVLESIRLLHGGQNLSLADKDALLMFNPVHWH